MERSACLPAENVVKDFMHRKKGQATTVEYVIMILLVVSVIVAMTAYMRRGLQGRIHDANRLVAKHAANAIGNSVVLEYEPYYSESGAVTQKTSRKQERVLGFSGTLIGTQTTTNALSTRKQFAPENR